ncbi:VCBS repeat-containing protein [Stieleria sp. ICT_E10.1]|uniref:FG-GAP repeat domain-containing protein n=1 Tax=Stieleria sedimenti TaxID=2976331 RepID=UPI00217F5863|nr:VCBS repeat-containing protein [Stieleria sedimenti]MCS7466615.1 VCBS repeat-containing protein [Stieleria sedimenti]
MHQTITVSFSLLLIVVLSQTTAFRVASAQPPWKRHTIDNTQRGADGVRLADFNGDGLMDVVTGWEESGLVRLYVNPGPRAAKEAWPMATIAKAKSPEDAVPMDLDGDGRMDIVSCHEGKQRQLLVHWNNAPASDSNASELLHDRNWTSERFKQLDGVMWMFALPLGKVDSRPALVVGAKGPKATITLLLGPATHPRDLSTWTTIRLRDAGWIMSLRAVDMDRDGDQDIVFSDRKGNRRVAAWLEQPANPQQPWTEHEIAGKDMEVMFLTATAERCLISTRERMVLDWQRSGAAWTVTKLPNPPGIELGKAIESLPDGQLVLTANTHASSDPDRPGIWIRDVSGNWSAIDPTTRVKFDRMELIDLDGDGDLDVMTCEERRNLGIIWYENPAN